MQRSRNYISKMQPPEYRHYGMDIYGYINNFSMRTALRCIELNLFINF